MIFLNVPRACLRAAGMVGFCFMTTAKACRGTGVSVKGRARLWDLVWVRIGNNIVMGGDSSPPPSSGKYFWLCMDEVENMAWASSRESGMENGHWRTLIIVHDLDYVTISERCGLSGKEF